MKVTLVLDEADADRLAYLAQQGVEAVTATDDYHLGDAALVERIRTARRHRHRGDVTPRT